MALFPPRSGKQNHICPHCGISVRHLARHLVRVHNKTIPVSPSSCAAPSPTQNTGPVSKHVAAKTRRDEASKAQSSHSIEQVTVRRVPKGHVICPFCKKAVIHLARHVTKVHDKSPAAPASRPQRITAASHDTHSNPADSPVSRPRVARSHKTQPCPVCGASVRTDRLERHKARVHKQANFQKRIPKPSTNRPSGKSKSSPAIGPCVIESSPPERRLDAGRDYFAAYRDNGRYGSYPSHDDYGDESEP